MEGEVIYKQESAKEKYFGEKREAANRVCKTCKGSPPISETIKYCKKCLVIDKKKRPLHYEYIKQLEDEKISYEKRKTLERFKENVRTSIKNTFKKNGYKKSNRTHEILRCSFEEFKKYIEDQFEPWMNWDNHGIYTGNVNETWHLDHIVPLASAETEEDVVKLNHYTNFQPLCSYVNQIVKRDKFDYTLQGDIPH